MRRTKTLTRVASQDVSALGEYLQVGFLVPYEVDRVFTEEDLVDGWQQFGPRILEEHIAETPGTRPWGWWQFEAPGRRRVLGVRYTPASERAKGTSPTTWEKRIDPVDDPHTTGVPGDYVTKPVMPCSLVEFVLEDERVFLERHGLLRESEVA